VAQVATRIRCRQTRPFPRVLLLLRWVSLNSWQSQRNGSVVPLRDQSCPLHSRQSPGRVLGAGPGSTKFLNQQTHDRSLIITVQGMLQVYYVLYFCRTIIRTFFYDILFSLLTFCTNLHVSSFENDMHICPLFYFKTFFSGLMPLPSDRFSICLSNRECQRQVRHILPAYLQARLRGMDDNLVIFVKFRERHGRGRQMT